MVNSTIQSLQIDTYTQHILQALASSPDILEVEISPQGEDVTLHLLSRAIQAFQCLNVDAEPLCHDVFLC